MSSSVERNKAKQRVGRVGEDLACRFLEGKGFSIVDRNYRKFTGEIDIIAKKDKTLYFVEVKTVSRENFSLGDDALGHRAEDNLHPQKLKRINRAINAYLQEKRVDMDCAWQCDAVVVNLFAREKKAKIKYLENIFA